MIYIGTYVFEIVKGPLKILRLKIISDKGMSPYYADGKFSIAIAEAYRNTVLNDLHYITKKIFNEGYYMNGKILDSLEVLAKYYQFKTLMAWFDRYRENWELVSSMNKISVQEKHRPIVEHENMKAIEEFKDEIMLSDLSKEMKDIRINYLEDQNTNLSSHLNKIKAKCQQMTDRDYAGWLISFYQEMKGYKGIASKHKHNKISISFLKDGFSSKEIRITKDMIQLAKQVPFSKLLKLEDVGSRQRCKCPFHNEKTASFYVYPDTNRGHCHGCGKNVDTIQYLVEIKKITFNQAVLMLLSY